MRSIPARAVVLAVLSAVLQVFSFPTDGPVSLWRAGLSWIALAPFLLALLQKDVGGRPGLRVGAWIGYLCGVVFYLGNCLWIYQTMYLYGGMAKPVAALILLLFSLYLGLYHALFGALFTVVRQSRLGVRGALLLAPFAWVAVELARSRITGFPWDLQGNALVDNLFVTRIAPITGVMGISFLIAAGNAAIASFWAGDKCLRWVLSGVGVVTVSVLEVAGVMAPQAGGNIGNQQIAVMVQENIAVGASAKGAKPLSVGEELQVFGDLSLHLLAAGKDHYGLGRPAVILWPEAPSELRSDDPEVRAALAKVAKTADAPVIAGSLGVDLDRSVDRGYDLYDSATLFDRAGSYAGRYDKIHLVPWGEYVPYKEFFGFAKKLTAGSGDMDRGHTRSVFKTDGHGYGVFICYESIFGDEVREFVKNGAEVLVNISDDGWYGDTGAPWQHLNMARMRAIENHRWVLRATNTGETTTIDPLGRYVETERHVRTVYALPFEFEAGTTFYTRHGDWFAYLCAMVTIAGLAYGVSFKLQPHDLK